MSGEVMRHTPAQNRMATIVHMYVCHLMAACRNEGSQETSKGRKAEFFVNLFPPSKFFFTETVPSISLLSYVQHIVAHVNCSPEAYIFALVYMKRLSAAGFPLETRSVYRIFLTAVVVAARVRDDFLRSKKSYSVIGGVTTRDLNAMEFRFLADLLEYGVEVSIDEYRALCNEITILESSGKVDGLEGSPNISGSASDEEPLNSPTPQWILDCCLHW
uniref:Putative cyclin 7 n=1 Tax=Trypanosoma congolense (strain IL3000) TaxID=1068625 RepID=G0UP77_TRYCI|nr:putative cyclin 7 [Trypanosoma congolense IL3000]